MEFFHQTIAWPILTIIVAILGLRYALGLLVVNVFTDNPMYKVIGFSLIALAGCLVLYSIMSLGKHII